LSTVRRIHKLVEYRASIEERKIRNFSIQKKKSVPNLWLPNRNSLSAATTSPSGSPMTSSPIGGNLTDRIPETESPIISLPSRNSSPDLSALVQEEQVVSPEKKRKSALQRLSGLLHKKK
jgi:hypothetical protein